MMTSAPTVRLFALLLASGVTVGGVSLSAQNRQYVPDQALEDLGPPTEALLASDSDNWWDVSAYVSIVDGDAELLRAGESARDFSQVPLEVGDTLRTSRGRVEVLFDDGSVLSLDQYTTLTIQTQQAWLLQGGRVKAVWRGTDFDLDSSPTGTARLQSDGEYWITFTTNRRGEPELELAVTRGRAELANALGRTLVRPNTRALTTAAYAPSVPYAFATPRDTFDRWIDENTADRYGVESVRYLPPQLRVYGGAFDRYGSWSHHSTYGWVWYPRVSVGWQPYYGGHWSFVVNFGYSWVGGARWEWPAYHYGRWDRLGSRWFWVPSRTVLTRHVGYAVPRRSVATTVSYYQRPVTARTSRETGNRGNTVSGYRANGQNGRPSASGVSTPPRPTQQDRAVLRSAGTIGTTSRPNSNNAVAGRSPGVTPRSAIPRNQPTQATAPARGTPSTRPPSTTRTPSRQAPRTTSAPPTSTQRAPRRTAPSATRQTPQRSTPTARQAPQRSTPAARQAPQRSAPSARTPTRSAPPSGSRTPSAGSRSSSGSSGSSRSGTATRRGGRGGGGGDTR